MPSFSGRLHERGHRGHGSCSRLVESTSLRRWTRDVTGAVWFNDHLDAPSPTAPVHDSALRADRLMLSRQRLKACTKCAGFLVGGLGRLWKLFDST